MYIQILGILFSALYYLFPYPDFLHLIEIIKIYISKNILFY